MKKLLPSLILLISIGVLVTACATSDDSSTSSTDNTTSSSDDSSDNSSSSNDSSDNSSSSSDSSDNSSSSSNSSSTTDVEGTWVTSCKTADWNSNYYVIESITVSGSTLIHKWEAHSDSSCANDYALWTDTFSSFSLGAEATLDNGSTARKISMKVDSLEGLMQTSTAVADYNEDAWCEITDWALNTAKDYSGRTCFSSSGETTYWSANTNVYGVYLLDGNCLSISSLSSSGYPSTVDSLMLFTKQSATTCADTTPPTVSSISPADGQTGVSASGSISVTFSETMNYNSVTVNTDNTTCYGSLALSSDNFSTCVKMSSSKSSSNSNKTFTFRASTDSVLRGNTYKIRVTTAVEDTYGNSMSSQYETSNGFTTTSGLFVAVGDNGTILTSDNGTEWTARTSGTSEKLNRVAYGNGRFYAVGDNAKATFSDNGSSWTAYGSGNVHHNDVEYFGDSNWGLVAHYGKAAIWNPVTGRYSYMSLAEDNESSYFFKNYRGLTIGDDIILVGDQGIIVWSPDNDSRFGWFTTKNSGTTSNLMGTVHGNSIYVIVGDNGTILTSDNGSSWTSRADGRLDNLAEVTFGNNTFIAVGDNGTIRTSSDNGTTWDNRTSGTTNLYGVTFGKNTFIVVGDNGTIRTSSDNGTTWDNRTSGTTVNLRGVGF